MWITLIVEKVHYNSGSFPKAFFISHDTIKEIDEDKEYPDSTSFMYREGGEDHWTVYRVEMPVSKFVKRMNEWKRHDHRSH